MSTRYIVAHTLRAHPLLVASGICTTDLEHLCFIQSSPPLLPSACFCLTLCPSFSPSCSSLDGTTRMLYPSSRPSLTRWPTMHQSLTKTNAPTTVLALAVPFGKLSGVAWRRRLLLRGCLCTRTYHSSRRVACRY